jgi:2-octaprenyl-6-methoxyphenol hydroxylase
MQNTQFDVVIAGGSFVGLTLAIALSKASGGDIRVAIVDAAPRQTQLSGGYDGRSAAISAAAKTMLDVLGLWEAVAPNAQPIRSIDITDTELDTPLRTTLLSFQAEVRENLAAAYMVENTYLRQALFQAAERARGVAMVMPASVSAFSVQQANLDVALSDGLMLNARLLVAADGQKSALRKLAGIKTLEWTTPQVGIVAAVSHEAPHEGRAVQHFLPAGPFAMLPLTGNRTSFVWTEQPREAARVMRLDAPALTEEIERRFGLHLGRLTVLSPPVAYPLSMTLAREFVMPRFALAGDAAHGLHWIAGQGLNHGLKDVAALAEVIIDAARLGLDIGDVTVLRRYEQWRRFDSATGAFAAAAINRLFTSGGAPMRALRGFGLGLVNRVESVKRFFVHEAAGMTGAAPKLMRGEMV